MRTVLLLVIVSLALIIAPVRASVRVAWFAPRVNAAQEQGSMAGTVVAPDSSAVLGAKVLAVRRVAAGATPPTLLSAYTDAKGKFHLDSVPSGEYELHVTTAGRWMYRELIAPVTIRDSATITVDARLQPIDQCSGQPLPALTQADKTELVRIMLNEALVKKAIPSYANLMTTKQPVLAATNIESLSIPKFTGFKELLLSPDQIQAKANREGDLMFLRFETIASRGSCVAVTLCNLWADGTSTIETGPKTRLGEGCLYYVFYKRDGAWRGDFLEGWIS